jgi:hypothetical protein
MSKSDTPETDAAEWYCGYAPVVRANFASGLERQRDELANTLRALVDYCRASAEEGYDPFAADALLDMADAALARFKEGKR